MKLNNIKEIDKLLNEDKILNLNALGRIKFNQNYNLTVDELKKGFLLQLDYWHVVYSGTDHVAEELIRNIDTKTEKGFSGVGVKYYQLAKKHHEIKWEEPCYLYYLEEHNLNTSLLNHCVDSLTEKDAELVNEFYTYKDENSIEYIRDCIISRPSSVVRDEQGNPVSWALIREDGSMGVMYTLKEHRGQGYANSVSVDLAKKAFDLGLTPYVHIVKGNTPSVKLAENLGFKFHCDVMWFGI